jgi:hypothetical protein
MMCTSWVCLLYCSGNLRTVTRKQMTHSIHWIGHMGVDSHASSISSLYIKLQTGGPFESQIGVHSGAQDGHLSLTGAQTTPQFQLCVTELESVAHRTPRKPPLGSFFGVHGRPQSQLCVTELESVAPNGPNWCQYSGP